MTFGRADYAKFSLRDIWYLDILLNGIWSNDNFMIGFWAKIADCANEHFFIVALITVQHD